MPNEQQDVHPRSRTRWGRVGGWLREATTLATVVWLVIVCVLAVVAVWFNTDGSQRCPVLRIGAPVAVDAAVPVSQLPNLEPTAERPAAVPLGRGRTVRTARSSLTVTAATTDEAAAGADDDGAPTGGTVPVDPPLDDVDAPLPLEVRLNPFAREDGATLLQSDRSGPGDAVPLMTAHAFSRRGTVVVELCVDRDGVALGHPGRYEGSVTVVDPRVTSTDVPFVVTMAYPNAALVGLLTVVAVAVAAVYSWGVHHAETIRNDTRTSISFRPFFNWLGSWSGLLTVASGSVAAYVAYSATYLSNAVWGTSVTQFTAIVGAVFTAFVTAASTIIAGTRGISGSRGSGDDADQGGGAQG